MDDDVRIQRSAPRSGPRRTDPPVDQHAGEQGLDGLGNRANEGAATTKASTLEEEPEVARQQGREELRGELFTDLDRLAFALELEAAEAVEAGDEDRALRLENHRLGVRLAQRLVSGVHAYEVEPRVARAARAYDDRTR